MQDSLGSTGCNEVRLQWWAKYWNKPILPERSNSQRIYFLHIDWFRKINFAAKYFAGNPLLGIRKGVNLGFNAGIQLQNKNHTEDWALGCHPRDNCLVTQ